MLREIYGVSFYDWILIDVLGLKGKPDKHHRGFLLDNHMDDGKKKQLVFNDQPLNRLAGTNMFFANTNIIQQQHAVLKSTLLRNVESQRGVSNGRLDINSTILQIFSELQFKKLITSTIEEFQIQLAITGQTDPVVGTGKIALTLIFKKFLNLSSIIHELFCPCSLVTRNKRAVFSGHYQQVLVA